MGTQPIAKELVWDSNMRCGILNPVQMHGREPRVIDLFRYLALNVMERLLPHRLDTHKPLKFLYTGLFTPVDN